jgi:predicted dehydrogenase/uncharacterized membrane protein
MHFALLGDHPDGLQTAHALAASGRHTLIALDADAAQAAGNSALRFSGFKVVADLEEVLADPAVEAVIVASRLDTRPTILRRALQAERHVLCVHPADTTPDIAYEAALIQGDTKRALVPLWIEGLHPALSRLTELSRSADAGIGTLQFVHLERESAATVLEGAGTAGGKLAFPGWGVLRALGGDIAELSAFAAEIQLTEDDPVLVSGRFEGGGLFQASFLPRQPRESFRVQVTGNRGRGELELPIRWGKAARLQWQEPGESHQETWAAWDPGPSIVSLFEESVAAAEAKTPIAEALLSSWQDEVRGLELDDTARRSIERRRAGTLEYQQASEEVGFKGTMTLVGCALVWIIILLVILSRWLPALGWLIVPLIVLFLLLQMFRWIVPKPAERNESERTPPVNPSRNQRFIQ